MHMKEQNLKKLDLIFKFLIAKKELKMVTYIRLLIMKR